MGKLAEDVALASAELSPAWTASEAHGYSRAFERSRSGARRPSALAVCSPWRSRSARRCSRRAAPSRCRSLSMRRPRRPVRPPMRNRKRNDPRGPHDSPARRLARAALRRAERARDSSTRSRARRAEAAAGPRALRGGAERTAELRGRGRRRIAWSCSARSSMSAQRGARRVSVERGRVRVYGRRAPRTCCPCEQALRVVAAPVVRARRSSRRCSSRWRSSRSSKRARRPKQRRAIGRGSSHDSPSWRSLTQSGDYDAAFKSLQEAKVVQNDRPS